MLHGKTKMNKRLVSLAAAVLLLIASLGTAVFAATGIDIDKNSYYSYTFFSDDFESYTKNELLPVVNMSGNTPGFNYKVDNTQPEGARATVVEAPVEPEKYGNAVKLGYSRGIDNYIVTPYGLTGSKYDIGDVNRVKISMSIMFDGYAEANFRVLGSDPSNRGGTYFWSFYSNGTAGLNQSSDGVGGTASNIENFEKYSTYELNKWYNYELYLDFTLHTFDLYINGDEITTYHPFGERLKDFCVFRIQISSVANAEGEEGTELLSNIYTDNWKYEFPEYLSIEHDGFTQPLATPDFNSLTVGEIYTTDTNNIKIGNTNALAQSEEGRGTVLKFNATTTNSALVGTSSYWMNSFIAKNGILPKIIKLETNVKLSNENSKKFAAYIEFIGRKPGTENDVESAYLASFLSSGKLRIGRTEQGDTPVEIAYTLDRWYNFKFYVDAEEGVYEAYVNGDYIGKFLLNVKSSASEKTPITQPLQVRITSNANAKSDVNFIYTDKVEIYTLPCYTENVISQYKIRYNNTNAAYCLEAGDENDASALIVAAVYDAGGKLIGISSEPVSAAAGEKTCKKVNVINVPADTSEQNYRVFALNNFGSIEPLAQSMAIK